MCLDFSGYAPADILYAVEIDTGRKWKGKVS